ncbi:cysteine hydrolase family protein [Streptacidiphilus sp. PB12-B1b]|uniref:cysteine hydrolase family protein n=1 Tax=Streptacidiphilus sp. PB12-B1b TaxID=2705012 RepID=UPI00351A54F2
MSAFTGSELEVVLRSPGAIRLVLAGISTSGVVLSTVREAADRGYRLTVLAVAGWATALGPDAQGPPCRVAPRVRGKGEDGAG